MKNSFRLFLLMLSLTGCQTAEKTENRQFDSVRQIAARTPLSQETVNFNTNNPNIGISSYVLISDNVAAHRADAEAIMDVKKDFPLAVQTKNRALFEKILAHNFVFRSEDSLLGREEYISDRTNPVNGKVLRADYENIVLQFFDQIAVMTYRNIVKGTNPAGQPDDPEHITWADIYVKEDGEWKIGSVHVIDYRAEKEAPKP